MTSNKPDPDKHLSKAVRQLQAEAKEDAAASSPWGHYKRKGLSEMRPYIPGEDLSTVSVSDEDTPETGGMIARNPENHADQWYVAAKYFAANFYPA